jgi:arsenate reductase-like glutaredoxin family protein
VNGGSIQTTRRWVKDNAVVAKVAEGGRKRMSRAKLEEVLAAAKSWHSEAATEA